jgi:putative pyruvate formate lyase activating enzyme
MIDPAKKIDRINNALDSLSGAMDSCELCGHRCRVNRTSGQKGACRAGVNAEVFTYNPHFGEEPPISGRMGSGTIFFSNCGMACAYCQNWQFSQSGAGKEVSPERLAAIMLELAGSQCHNINLVSPTHYIVPILKALAIAYKNGLSVPLVYNTGGYDSPALIDLLRGIVDIYLPDMRYSNDAMALKYSKAGGYTRINQTIVKKMKDQTGDVVLAEDTAVTGLIIRLLVLPNSAAGTEDTLGFIAKELGTGTYLSVMSQYRPVHNAAQFQELNRGLTASEYSIVLDKMKELGLCNGWIQPLGSPFNMDLLGENFKQKNL